MLTLILSSVLALAPTTCQMQPTPKPHKVNLHRLPKLKAKPVTCDAPPVLITIPDAPAPDILPAPEVYTHYADNAGPAPAPADLGCDCWEPAPAWSAFGPIADYGGAISVSLTGSTVQPYPYKPGIVLNEYTSYSYSYHYDSHNVTTYNNVSNITNNVYTRTGWQGGGGSAHKAPEIGAGGAASGLTILACFLAIMTGGRRRIR